METCDINKETIMNITFRIVPALSLACLFLFSSAVPARAQDEPPERAGRKRIEDYRRVKLIETLDLNEEQAVRFIAREKEFRENERGMQEQRQASLERLRQLVKDGGDADVQKEMNTLIQIGKDMMQKRVDYFTNLKDVLSTKQMARLMIFEDNFAKELRRVLQSPKMRERLRDR